MAQVVCEVSAGLRDSERTVAVRDIHGRRQFLRVEQDFLTHRDDQFYLPVGEVYYTADDKVLIELPHEADSGANRLWVHRSDLLAPTKATA
jgi:hypothetical protein